MNTHAGAKQHQGSHTGTRFQVFFDPGKSNVELLDELAEKQADAFPDKNINSNQLRKYFGEIKDLYRQFQARTVNDEFKAKAECYMETFEPRFKMIRSKVAYGQRQGGQGKLSKEFAGLISEGIQKVGPGNYKDFERFVMHLEAVVGFMYGKEKVSK